MLSKIILIFAITMVVLFVFAKMIPVLFSTVASSYVMGVLTFLAIAFFVG